jgi:uncharacterized membrane protein required for colicin V production
MPIDIGFYAFFAYGFWQGYSRGIISTVLNMALYVFGVVLAFKMAPTTAAILQSLYPSENPTMFLAAFLVNLFTLMLITRQSVRGLEHAMRMAYLGILNQVGGGVAMASFSVILYSVLIWFATKVEFINEATIAESRTHTILEPLPTKVKDFAIRMKPFVLEAWGTSMKWMDRLDQYGGQRTEDKNKTYPPPDAPKAIEDNPKTGTREPVPRSAPLQEDGEGIEE